MHSSLVPVAPPEAVKAIPSAIVPVRQLSVTLAHAPNPDIRSGGYRGDIPPRRKAVVPVGSLAEASRVCTAFIDKYGLGGGNWTGGDVRDNGKVIARISYNGRCWTPAKWGTPEHKEIPLAK